MTALARISRNAVAAQRMIPLLIRRSHSIRRHPSRTGFPRELSSQSSSELATTGENLPSKPIDFAVSAKIEGEESQIAKVKLRPGEVLRAESGAMLYMTEGIEMNTSSSLQGGFNRLMTGQNLFFSDFKYTPTEGEGEIGLGTDLPAKILRLSLEDYGSSLICQRGAYMASNPSVNIEMEYTKSLTAGFFGGQGFILQRLVGEGDVLVKAGGTLVVKDLDANETIRVTSGSIVAFESSIDYDVQMMPGIKNAMFGGEGLFVTTLKGPGRIWLQGMPADRMIAEIARRVPSGGGIGLGIPIGGGGVGGGGEDGAVADAGSEAGVGTESGEEMVAATDAAVDADRQATVASSGMMDNNSEGSADGIDAESPSALFGDAASESQTSSSAAPSSSATVDPFEESTGVTETTFSDDADETMFNDETTFSTDDDYGFSSSEEEQFSQDQQHDMFEDSSTTTDIFESGSGAGTDGEEASDAVGGILGTLWDIFTGGDD